jgi:hypothetical protein
VVETVVGAGESKAGATLVWIAALALPVANRVTMVADSRRLVRTVETAEANFFKTYPSKTK